MALVDRKKEPKSLTANERNQAAADTILAILTRASRMQRTMIKNIKNTIKKAPGSKATILALLGDDEAEATSMIDKIKDFANAHKGEGENDLTV